MPDYGEEDYARVVGDAVKTQFLPGTSIEVIRDLRRGAPPLHALFDFDGTLSLVREGWPEVMVPMMVDVLKGTGTAETPEALHKLAYGFVMELNGKQTIYQMMRLAEEVTARGGRPRDPLEYKQMYQDRLMERICSRREALRTGKVRPEEMLVPGSIEFLGALKARGVRLYLASGTDERYVREECALLTLDKCFGEHIYGAIADYKSFSKATVIERILAQNKVEGPRLIGFGDGYVEIQNLKSVGGIAVAVASDEAGRSGKADPWKRDRLIGVGADMVIPDFREHARLIEHVWGR
jgi:phosphoglycolate phosphatase